MCIRIDGGLDYDSSEDPNHSKVTFKYRFVLDGDTFIIVQGGENFELRVNNQAFSYLLERERNKNEFQYEPNPYDEEDEKEAPVISMNAEAEFPKEALKPSSDFLGFDTFGFLEATPSDQKPKTATINESEDLLGFFDAPVATTQPKSTKPAPNNAFESAFTKENSENAFGVGIISSGNNPFSGPNKNQKAASKQDNAFLEWTSSNISSGNQGSSAFDSGNFDFGKKPHVQEQAPFDSGFNSGFLSWDAPIQPQNNNSTKPNTGSKWNWGDQDEDQGSKNRRKIFDENNKEEGFRTTREKKREMGIPDDFLPFDEKKKKKTKKPKQRRPSWSGDEGGDVGSSGSSTDSESWIPVSIQRFAKKATEKIEQIE